MYQWHGSSEIHHDAWCRRTIMPTGGPSTPEEVMSAWLASNGLPVESPSEDQSFFEPSFVYQSAPEPIQGQRISMPMFEMASNPTIQISDIRSRRFNLMDRIGTASRQTDTVLTDPADIQLGPYLSIWQRLDRDDVV